MIYVCKVGSWPSTYTSVANVANVSRIQVSDSNHWAGAITINLSVSFCLGNIAILLADSKFRFRYRPMYTLPSGKILQYTWIQVSDSNHWAGAITNNFSVSFCLGNIAILLVD
jgi:hypothetical protein